MLAQLEWAPLSQAERQSAVKVQCARRPVKIA